MSKKFLAALIILPTLAAASYVSMRIYQANELEKIAEELKHAGCSVNFEDNRILFIIPTETAKSVYIESYGSVSSDTVEKLRYFPRVERIDVKLVKATDSDLESLLAIDKLITLDLSCTDVTDEGMSTLAKLPAFEWLDLSYTVVSDEGVKRLPKKIFIKATASRILGKTTAGWSLSISNMTGAPTPPFELIKLIRDFHRLTDRGYDDSCSLMKSTSLNSSKSFLTTINLDVDRIGESQRKLMVEMLTGISKHSDIRVCINGFYYNYDEYKQGILDDSPEFNAILTELCKIELIDLDLSFTSLTPDQWKTVRYCKTLESIAIGGSESGTLTLPGHLYRAAIKCNNLRSIDIDGGNSKLKEICLTNVPSEGIAFLSKCPNLERIDFHKLSTPCDLSPLSELPKLKTVSFPLCGEGLDVESLTKCGNLSTIRITFANNGGLSDDDINQLRWKLPDTKLEIE